MLVDIAQHRIALEEGCEAAAGSRHREARVDRVAEISGVPEKMAGRHHRRVGRREGREQRVRVLEIDAVVANGAYGRRRLLRDDEGAEPVRYEEHDIVRLTGRGSLQSHDTERERRGKCQACQVSHESTSCVGCMGIWRPQRSSALRQKCCKKSCRTCGTWPRRIRSASYMPESESCRSTAAWRVNRSPRRASGLRARFASG